MFTKLHIQMPRTRPHPKHTWAQTHTHTQTLNTQVEDMGYRMGLNGVDNAKLFFENVRVPQENLLNRYSDIDENGVFSTQIESPRARFLTVADQVRIYSLFSSFSPTRHVFCGIAW